MSNELITVPTFNFSQGDTFDGAEHPIQVCYYNGLCDFKMIELVQEERSIQFTSIKELKQLVKLIENHLPEATKVLDKKYKP